MLRTKLVAIVVAFFEYAYLFEKFSIMKLFYILVTLLLISCSNKTGNQDVNVTLDSDNIRLRELLCLTTELPYLQEYYGVLETIKQHDIVVLENRFTRGIKFKNVANRRVVLLTAAEIQKANVKAFLEYKSVEIRNDSAYVYYRYDVQGVGVEVTYLYRNNAWILKNYKLWEN